MRHGQRTAQLEKNCELVSGGSPGVRCQSSELLQTLIAADVVDEFRIWVYPLILGQGRRLFEKGVPPRGLTLVESRRTPNGVLLNTYRPTGPLPQRRLDPDNPSEAELARRRKLATEEAEGDTDATAASAARGTRCGAEVISPSFTPHLQGRAAGL